MSSYMKKESGFTAVELLITLFVAAAFILAGYQLYAIIIKDNGETRAQAIAAGVANTYMRHYATTADCSSSKTTKTLRTTGTITVTGLSVVTAGVTGSCPYPAVAISKVTATIKYNTPQQVITSTVYVSQ